jgi:hypothetical protein
MRLFWLNDASISLVHIERRFGPFFRLLFDAILRDPLTNLATALISRKPANERLQLAEEKPLTNEDQFLDSIIKSCEEQMSLLWKPGRATRPLQRHTILVNGDRP